MRRKDVDTEVENAGGITINQRDFAYRVRVELQLPFLARLADEALRWRLGRLNFATRTSNDACADFFDIFFLREQDVTTARVNNDTEDCDFHRNLRGCAFLAYAIILRMENNKYFLPAAVVLAGLFIGGAVLWNGSHPAQVGVGTGTTPPAPSVNVKDVKTDGEPFIGSATALVTIAEWSDYQCPYCEKFETETLPQIVQNYVTAGKVKVVFKDFAFLGPDSMVDAEYARAVWALYPAQFGAWRTALYSQEPQENSLSAADNLTFVLKVTGSVSGIDVKKVTANVTANQATYDTAINADKAEAANFGISATPSFVIGTQMIAGAYPYATFQAAIDPLLK